MNCFIGNRVPNDDGSDELMITGNSFHRRISFIVINNYQVNRNTVYCKQCFQVTSKSDINITTSQIEVYWNPSEQSTNINISMKEHGFEQKINLTVLFT